MSRTWNSLATFAVLGIPVWLVLLGALKTRPSTLTVHLTEPYVDVWVDHESYRAYRKLLGPIEVLPGRRTVKVSRGSETLYSETVDVGDRRDVAVNATWNPEPPPAGAYGEAKRFDGHTHAVLSVAFSPDGRRVLSSGRDDSIRLWDVETGRETRRFSGHDEVVTCVAFHPDGRRIISGSFDTSVRVWDADTGELTDTIQSNSSKIHALDVSRDGRRVIFSLEDHSVRVWDLVARKETSRFRHDGFVTSSVAFSPDGRYAICGLVGRPKIGNDVTMWDVSGEPKLVRRFVGNSLPVWSVRFSPDGRSVLSGGGDGAARIWNAESGELVKMMEVRSGSVLTALFSADGKRVLTGNGYRWNEGWRSAEEYRATLWSLEGGEELRAFEHTEPIRALAFAPDGRRAVSAGDDHMVRLWELPP